MSTRNADSKTLDPELEELWAEHLTDQQRGKIVQALEHMKHEEPRPLLKRQLQNIPTWPKRRESKVSLSRPSFIFRYALAPVMVVGFIFALNIYLRTMDRALNMADGTGGADAFLESLLEDEALPQDIFDEDLDILGELL